MKKSFAIVGVATALFCGFVAVVALLGFALVMFLTVHGPLLWKSFEPRDWQPLTTQPSNSDIAGRWVGSFEKAGWEFKDETSLPEIIFRDDHTFEARNFPYLPFGDWTPQLFTFSGTWRVWHKTAYNWYEVSRYVVEVSTANMDGEGNGLTFPINLGTTQKGLALSHTVHYKLYTEVFFYKAHEPNPNNEVDSDAKEAP